MEVPQGGCCWSMTFKGYRAAGYRDLHHRLPGIQSISKDIRQQSWLEPILSVRQKAFARSRASEVIARTLHGKKKETTPCKHIPFAGWVHRVQCVEVQATRSSHRVNFPTCGLSPIGEAKARAARSSLDLGIESPTDRGLLA